MTVISKYINRSEYRRLYPNPPQPTANKRLDHIEEKIDQILESLKGQKNNYECRQKSNPE